MAVQFKTIEGIARKVSREECAGWRNLPEIIPLLEEKERSLGIDSGELVRDVESSTGREQRPYRRLVSSMRKVARKGASEELAEAKLRLGALRVVEEASKLEVSPTELVVDATGKRILKPNEVLGFFSSGFYDGSEGCRVSESGAFTTCSLEELMRRDISSPEGEHVYFVRRDKGGFFLEKIDSTPRELLEALDTLTRKKDGRALKILEAQLRENRRDAMYVVFLAAAIERFKERGVLDNASPAELEEFYLVYRHHVVNQTGRITPALPSDYHGLLHFHFNVRGSFVDGKDDVEAAKIAPPLFIFAYEKEGNKTGVYVLTPGKTEHAGDVPHGAEFDRFTDTFLTPPELALLGREGSKVNFGLTEPRGLKSVKFFNPSRGVFTTTYVPGNPSRLTLNLDLDALGESSMIFVNQYGVMSVLDIPPIKELERMLAERPI